MTFPAAVAETTADGAVGWEGIKSWGDAEWATKTGKIIGTYSKKADRAAKKGKTGVEADFRALMYGALAGKYGVDPREVVDAAAPNSNTTADDDRSKRATCISPPPSLGELSLERWLEGLFVEQYAEGLRDHGVISVASMAEMSASELTDLLTSCAVKKGHQKKISKALALALAAHDAQVVAPANTVAHADAPELLPERAPRDIRRLNWQLEGAQRELDELREMKQSYESNAADADTEFDVAAANTPRVRHVIAATPVVRRVANLAPVSRGLVAAAAMARARDEDSS
jgi:hypothetical protein